MTELGYLELIVGLKASSRTPEERAAMWRETLSWQVEQRITKLQAIAQEHGIDTAQSLWLISLAEKAYLRPPKPKAGRPRGSTKKVGGFELVKAVESNQRPEHPSIRKTCV